MEKETGFTMSKSNFLKFSFQRDSNLPSITYFFLFFVFAPLGGVTGRLEFKLPYGNFFLLSAGYTITTKINNYITDLMLTQYKAIYIEKERHLNEASW